MVGILGVVCAQRILPAIFCDSEHTFLKDDSDSGGGDPIFVTMPLSGTPIRNPKIRRLGRALEKSYHLRLVIVGLSNYFLWFMAVPFVIQMATNLLVLEKK